MRFDDRIANNALLDELFGRLFTDFTLARRRAVRAMLREVVGDQALMLQLTPEAMEVFNASVGRRPGVRYGSVVAQATRPTFRSTIGAGLDPGAQVTRALYGALYPLAAATPHRLAPRLAPEVARVLRHAYGAIPSTADNDGIVPTRSQAWGTSSTPSLPTTSMCSGIFGMRRMIRRTSTGSCPGAASTADASRRSGRTSHAFSWAKVHAPWRGPSHARLWTPSGVATRDRSDGHHRANGTVKRRNRRRASA